MKKIFLLIFLIFSFSFSKDILSFTSEEKEFIKKHPSINVGAEIDWPPFDFVEDGQYTGIAKEYLSLIEKSTGLKFNYIYGSTWNELLQSAKNKKIDLLPILSKTKERNKYLLYTDKHTTIRNYLFSYSQKFNSLEELEGKTIAAPKGFAQEEYITKNYPNIKVVFVKDILEAIDFVITNKADALISNITLVNYLVKKHNLVNISVQFLLDKNSHLHMGIRNDYPILRNIIDKALKNISQKEKNRISNKWISGLVIAKNNSLTKKELKFIKNHKKIYIANEYDWVPYDYNEDTIAKGYVIDYTKLLFSKIGIEPIFITDTWDNLMNRFIANEINMLPVITYNKKRENFLDFTKPYMEQKFSIVTRIKRFDLINIDDLNGQKIALVKNWNSTKFIKKSYPNIKVIEVSSVKDAFEAVKNNIVDATIQNDILSNYFIQRDYNNILKSDVPVIIRNFDQKLYMGVNKKTPILKEIINKSMNQISEDEIRILNNKWLKQSITIDFTDEEKEFIDNTLINVIFTDNWAPINFMEKGKYYGLGYDFWELIASKANLKTKMNLKENFSIALKSIELKEDDIIIATSRTKDRDRYAIFSDTFYKAPIGIATLQDKNYIPDASHLVGKKVGVGRNYTAHKMLSKIYPDIDFIFIKNIEEGLDLLSDNKIYALVDNMPVLTHNIKKHAYSNIKISGKTGLDFNLQIMIRNDYPLLQSIINKVLIKLNPEEKEIILNKWAKIEYVNEINYLAYLKFIIPLLIVILVILYKNRQ